MDPDLRIVVVDDHPLYREGVVHILTLNGIHVLAEGASAADAIRLVAEHDPDVLLLDFMLPGGGLEATDAIVSSHARTAIVLLTVVDDAQCVADALKRGAHGYILKGSSGNEVLEAVRAVARGEFHIAPDLVSGVIGRLSGLRDPHGKDETVIFSDREEQVLKLLGGGLTNKEIAFQLDLSEKTVKYYLTHILKKLHVRNRVEAALYASRRAPVPH
jgi:two-component system nitrate/nitrite response regulator NarL